MTDIRGASRSQARAQVIKHSDHLNKILDVLTDRQAGVLTTDRRAGVLTTDRPVLGQTSGPGRWTNECNQVPYRGVANLQTGTALKKPALPKPTNDTDPEGGGVKPLTPLSQQLLTIIWEGCALQALNRLGWEGDAL